MCHSSGVPVESEQLVKCICCGSWCAESSMNRYCISGTEFFVCSSCSVLTQGVVSYDQLSDNDLPGLWTRSDFM